ncbi:hypothetical protein [Paracoccus sp. SY]|uniref:hypothetical protein n=1 Tax=Paracoccus sp. SY TaxID=1330255 RepID=UPI001864D577|nr:hypothetical protein [Paracoccus sp. SY]
MAEWRGPSKRRGYVLFLGQAMGLASSKYFIAKANSTSRGKIITGHGKAVDRSDADLQDGATPFDRAAARHDHYGCKILSWLYGIFCGRLMDKARITESLCNPAWRTDRKASRWTRRKWLPLSMRKVMPCVSACGFGCRC